MCNGDLGMYRVMPWAYPTIPGQSSGGTSVDPTPDPAQDCYDFSNLQTEFLSNSANTQVFDGNTYIKTYYRIVGVQAIDTSNVASVKLTASNGSLSVSPANMGSVSAVFVSNEETKTNRVEDLNTSFEGVTIRWPGVSVQGTSVSFTGSINVTITAYNSEGKVLQTKEIVVS